MALYTRLGDLLLGYAGLALLRSRVTDLGGKEFCDARVADIRRILEHWDDEPAFQWEAFWEEAPSAEGYAVWAHTYDTDPNPLIDLDDATLRPLLDRYPAGEALDAACGTGRWAKYLSQRGHSVRGIDESPEMLEVARATTPHVEFSRSDLRSVPLTDASVDLVVCSLALTYLPELDRVFAEFARVLRPGGHAVISNIHHLALMLGGVTQFRTPSGRAIRLPASLFMPTDYITAALRSGFGIRSCAELPWRDLEGGHGGPVAQAWCPEAARTACVGTPALVVVELELGR
ncbi:MAG: class I SAM-dependent methyltransferase [Chloroflexota bacterium]|nr:class I SAM-dependent methyltransferase [Chloroflexota bacterium]